MKRSDLNFAPVIAILVLIAIWEAACHIFSIPDFIFPSPSNIVEAFNKVGISVWWEHSYSTIKTCIVGFLLSFTLALIAAIAMTSSRTIKNTFYPLLVIIQSTPIVAIAPLLTVMLGTGEPPRVIITVLITFFPLVVSMTTGLSSTPQEFLELSRSIGAPKYREYTQIRFPYAVPFIFSGVKIAITLSIVGAVVAEFVAAERGLGYFIQFSTSYFSIANAFAGLVLLSLLSLLLFYSTLLLHKLIFPWSKSS